MDQATSKCGFEDCDNQQVSPRRLCETHEKVVCLVPGCMRKMSRNRICKFHLYPEQYICHYVGCHALIYRRGLCEDHYKVFGDRQAAPRSPNKRKASVSDLNLCEHRYCAARAFRFGKCKSYGSTEFIEEKAWGHPRRPPLKFYCRQEGCTKRAKSGGVCREHGGGRKCRLPECGQLQRRCDNHPPLGTEEKQQEQPTRQNSIESTGSSFSIATDPMSS